MPFWNITSTTLDNSQMYVNNTYKNANGNNALTTISPANPGGYIFVDPNNADPIVKNLAYSVQTDGKITYIESGSNTQYNSIQEFRNAKGIFSGYTDNTTKQIKAAMQRNLSNAVIAYNTANPDAPVGPSVAPPDPPGGPGGTAPSGDPKNTAFTTTIPGLTEQKEGSYNPPGTATAWIYPTGLGSNQQDYIEFQMIEYGGLKGNAIASNGIGLEARNLGTKVLGRVFLPIQPTISDINTVDWQNDSINPLQLLGAQTSMGLISGTMKEAEFSALVGKFSDNPAVQNYLQQWAAGKSVGLNIFSRFSGAVVNPNLELLFNGPQLRPFNFSFRLSPRSEDEAAQVKGIIRFFKKGMAVRKSGAGGEGLFLKAPNVFKIVYRNGNDGNKEHTSINKIKVCALTQCGVDYTPDGSYATFYDKDSTMTQYGLTLQFNELEPIFNEDYDKDAPGESTIGY